MRRKQAYHHGDLRTSIVRAGWQLIDKQGIAKLSLREAARLVGASHNAPSRHFPDRESLLAALAAEGFAALGRALQEAVASGGLRAMGEAYVRFALERPQRFRLMFGGAVPIAPHAALRENATRVFESLAQALAPPLPGAAGGGAPSAAGRGGRAGFWWRGAWPRSVWRRRTLGARRRPRIRRRNRRHRRVRRGSA